MFRASARGRHFICLAAISCAAIGASAIDTARIGAAAQMRDLTEGLRGATAGIGAANTVSIENLTFDLGSAVVRIPKIDVVGASLARAELMALFDKGAVEPLGARLTRLTAKQAAAPEIVVEQQVGPERQVTRYRNLVASDIKEGRAATISVDGATLEVKGGKAGEISGELGRMTFSDLDMPHAARVYAEKAGAQAEELKTIYGAFALENLAIRTDKAVEIKIARIAGKDFAARPTKTSWVETMKALSTAEEPDKASPAEQAKIMGAVGEFAEAMSIGSVEVTGIEIRDPQGKDEGIGRIARIAYRDAAGNQPADARFEGTEIVAKDGKARIGTIAFTGFSFQSTFAGLKDLGDKSIADFDPADLRKLVPTIGTIRLSGLDFDVPNETAKGPKTENIKFTLKNVEVTADKPRNGIPTNLRISVENIAFAVPPGTEEESLKDLAELGYKTVDLSWLMAASWNEPGDELVVREVSLRGAEMGSATVRGVLGNVSKDVFSADTAVALVALIGATAKNLDISIENNGLFERLIAREAKKNKKSAEELRREYGVAAAIAVPAMLGNSASAKAVGQAVAKFVARPVRLNISARTKDASGLGIADLASIDQPAAILDKLEVTATAE